MEMIRPLLYTLKIRSVHIKTLLNFITALVCKGIWLASWLHQFDLLPTLANESSMEFILFVVVV